MDRGAWRAKDLNCHLYFYVCGRLLTFLGLGEATFCSRFCVPEVRSPLSHHPTCILCELPLSGLRGFFCSGGLTTWAVWWAWLASSLVGVAGL